MVISWVGGVCSPGCCATGCGASVVVAGAGGGLSSVCAEMVIGQRWCSSAVVSGEVVAAWEVEAESPQDLSKAAVRSGIEAGVGRTLKVSTWSDAEIL